MWTEQHIWPYRLTGYMSWRLYCSSCVCTWKLLRKSSISVSCGDDKAASGLISSQVWVVRITYCEGGPVSVSLAATIIIYKQITRQESYVGLFLITVNFVTQCLCPHLHSMRNTSMVKYHGLPILTSLCACYKLQYCVEWVNFSLLTLYWHLSLSLFLSLYFSLYFLSLHLSSLRE